MGFLKSGDAKRITVPVTFDFMYVSSYGSGTESSGIVKIVKDLDETLENKDVLIVATKCDKISKGQWLKHIKQVREGLKADKEQKIIAFSSETGQGVEEVHQWVEEQINNYLPPTTVEE